ncbi:MAG TPA: hypothetical protein VLJ37_01360 [bacterium]|nr:hypothetical protein [bacterium]
MASEIDFRVIPIGNIFEKSAWTKLDKSFKISKVVDRDAESLGGTAAGVALEKEVPFRKLPGRRAAVAAAVEGTRESYHLVFTISYNADYLDRACGQRKYFYSPDIWEGAVEGVAGPASVAVILSGNYNRDRKTDLLVILSTGAAYVFQQIPGPLPPTTCEAGD